MMEIVVFGAAVFLIICTLLPLLKWEVWWVRICDFPRGQILICLIGVLVAIILLSPPQQWWHYLILLFVVASILFQSVKIFPYTPLMKKAVKKANSVDSNSKISLLIANVLMTNRNYVELLKIIHENDPDIVLTLESDKCWEENLRALENDRPYTVKVPQENLYGMHLYSKLEIENAKVEYLLDKEIPSIHGFVKMRSGKKFHLSCVHPKPPFPTEASSSAQRDAELVLVGKRVKQNFDTAIVAGDLNDVAWSQTTTLFQQVSGMLDPRRGRGFYNTFHAKYPFIRWPLDHLFHTADLALVDIKRLEKFGSDHFPIYVALAYEPENPQKETAPEADTQKLANEKINAAAEKK